MKKIYISTILLLLSTLFSFGQSQFNLSFDNSSFNSTGDTLWVEISISFDVLGKLGSSNLVFNYDDTALEPVDFEEDIVNPFYVFTLTELEAGRSSYNVTLAVPGSGDQIPATPMRLVTLAWEIKDPAGDLGIQWYEDATRGTVVFLDDESTQIASGTMADFSGSGGPLPVEWQSFDAKQWGSGAKLNWTTALELNNTGFWVERSIDANFFEREGFVPSQGDSEIAQAYEWIDQTAHTLGLEGPIYYRLKQVDLDGSTNHSEIRAVNFDLSQLNHFKVYPQDVLVGEAIGIELILPEDTYTKMELINSSGQLIHSVSEIFPAGLFQEVTFPTESISPGVYFLLISGENEIFNTTPVRIR